MATRDPTPSKRLLPALAGALIACALGMVAGGASGQSLQRKLDTTQEKLSHVQKHAGILTTRISHESAQLDRLTSEEADLRNRAAALAAQLAQ